MKQHVSFSITPKFALFCKFWRARSRLYQNEMLQEIYAFDSISQALQDVHTFAPLQSQNFSKNRFEKSAIFVKIQQHVANVAKSAIQLNLIIFARFQKFQLDNLLDFEKC